MGGVNGAAGDSSAATAFSCPVLGGSEERPSSRSVRFVLIEEGTSGFDAPSPTDAGAPTVVVAQSPAEPPGAFAIRAVRRVLDLELSGLSIDCTLLLLSPRFDPEAMAARLMIARGLITHSASMGSRSSELLLRAGCPSPFDLRYSLPSLMDALLGEPGSWALPIRASFHIAQAVS
ncbi:MAG: hypothetical protein ABI895_41315 [Deltaproteobacteria bacterium]